MCSSPESSNEVGRDTGETRWGEVRRGKTSGISCGERRGGEGRDGARPRNKRATVLLVLSDTANRTAALPSERGTCKCDVKGGANNNVWPSRISFRLAEATGSGGDELLPLNKTAHY